MIRHISKLSLPIKTMRATRFTPLCVLKESLIFPSVTTRNIMVSPIFQDEKKVDFQGIAKKVNDMHVSAFTKFAKDGSLDEAGCKQALKTAIPWMTDRHCDEIFKRWKGPKFTKEAFLETVNSIIGYKTTMDYVLQIALPKYDADKNGLLSSDELEKLFEKMDGEKDAAKRKAKVTAVLKHDKDKDGKISLDELKNWFWTDGANDPFNYVLTDEFIKEIPLLRKTAAAAPKHA